jgi:5-methylthioadenosine/S-adenosylhomocysteine deaminase
VASVLNRDLPDPFTSRELVEMVTVNPARILKWEGALGSLGPGKRADLIVVDGRQGNPYDQLLAAKETSLTLVMINGVARCGTPSLMERLGAVTETISLGDAERAVNLLQTTGDDVVGGLTLKAAADTLRDGLARLPELAKAREQPGFAATMTGITTAGREGRWVLELDHNVDNPIAPGLLSSPDQAAAARPPLSEVLQPIELDALSLADDRDYVARLQGQSTLRPAFVEGLAELYA